MNVLEHYNNSNISLGNAIPIDDDTYFCRLTYDNAPLIIKTNKVCFYRKRTSQYKTTDNYIHMSITSKEYLEWFDQFYNEMIEIFHKASEDWFEESMTLSDVEFCFINPLKSNIKNNCFDIACAIDEERLVLIDTRGKMIQLSNLEDSSVIPSFHIKGIKFNNKHFIFEIELTHLCVILPEEEESEDGEIVSTKESFQKPENLVENLPNHFHELNEFKIETDQLEPLDLEIEETGIYKVYDFINEKIKENMIEHIRKVFMNKKIKSKLDFYEMIDDEDSDTE